MPLPDDSPSTLSADDSLPRIEPPTAGFILQLFVVPAIIVVVIVMVWVMFNWLAQMGSDPHEYLVQIEKQNANSWIAAHNLAQELRTKPALKRNAAVARDLGRMLEKTLDAGHMSDDDIRLRVFLCRALGEFHVADGMPALLKAATVERQPPEVDVRRSALEALALLTSNVDEAKSQASTTAVSAALIDRDKLLATLLAAAGDGDARVREPAAYALGVAGGERAVAGLEKLLGDTSANVRFNAATGLARQGRASASEVLVEMLDLKELQGVREEDGPQAQDFKRALIAINALRAARQLAQMNRQADLAALEAAIEQLLAADISAEFAQPQFEAEIRAQAQAALKEMRSPTPAASR